MRILRALMFTFAAAMLTSLFGCMIPGSGGRHSQMRGAGLWDVHLPSGDLDAKVGYPFSASVYGSCESEKNREQWTYYLSYSGALPPGLTLQQNGITGIPTERGNYILHLRLTNSVCNGQSMEGDESDVRIHVTGSGAVIQ
jgi:hypothetical protein